KQIGDEFMLVFPDAGAAVEFGTSIRQTSDSADLPPLRIGTHIGPVLYREGDYYGGTVNLAARATSVAQGGQFVLTDAVRQQLDPTTTVVSLGEHILKGISEPVELYTLG